MIKETISFTFESEEQQKRFHERLKCNSDHDSDVVAENIVEAFAARYTADGHGKLEAGLVDDLREMIEAALRGAVIEVVSRE